MPETPPTPEDVARWLLATEEGPTSTPDLLADSARRLYLELRAGLAVFVGPTGFDSLWARAMHAAHGAQPPDARGGAVPTVTLPPGVPAIVLVHDAVAAREVLIRTFASVFGLLFRLLGPALALHLLREVWPGLLADRPGSQTGDITR